MQAKWGTLVLRRPSSYTEVSSVGLPCTKLKRDPLEHDPGQAGQRPRPHPQGEATRMQRAGDTAIRCRGQIPLSYLWPAHPCRNLFVHPFSFSTTPGILVSLLSHEFFSALEENTEVAFIPKTTQHWFVLPQRQQVVMATLSNCDKGN